MSGHSKWANIKHRKERADQQKGKAFSHAAKEIISAVKQGGVDPKSNNKLRIAIQKAKEVNLPNDVIERNIKKASSKEQGDYFEMSYELYGHGGVAIVVDIMTDNKNRISSDIHIATNKCGGSVAAPGACTFNFDRKGVIQVEKSKVIEEELFLVAMESGVEDFEVEDEIYLITTSPEELLKVKEALRQHKIPIVSASIEWIPKTLITCSKEDEEANKALLEWLENIEDVDAVYHNMDQI